MKKLLMISFDAVGDLEYEQLLKYPNFSALAAKAETHRNVQTVFLSNTYPIHASVVTGVHPAVHGLISNTEPFPSHNPVWLCEDRLLKATPLWRAAAERGIKTAAVLWPVTARSRHIRYNIPEVLARPGKSQVLANFSAGSKGLQLYLFLRYRHLLKGIQQPQRDAFATACMVDIMRRHRPGLMLMHLTCYDTLCHQYGKNYNKLAPAFAALDANLGALLAAADGETSVVVFSDHSQITVHTALQPNLVLLGQGLLGKTKAGWQQGPASCFVECCGGSAFLHPGSLLPAQIEALKALFAQSEGFNRFLTRGEMQACGRGNLPFGFCAAVGYCYEAHHSEEKGNHGYPLNYPDYSVFYMAYGPAFEAGKTLQGGSLLDLAPLAAKELGLQLPQLNSAV